MPGSQNSFWSELWRRSTALDRLISGYLLVFAIALAILGRQSPNWLVLFSAHLLIFALICIMLWFLHKERTGIAGFIRALYPVMLFSLFYSELEVADFWVHSEFLDARIISFERAIFGVDPNIWIIPAQSAWINEIMMAGYFSYYLLIPLASLLFYFRRYIDELRGMLYGVTVAFVLSYIGFVMFPVEGPRYHFSAQFVEPLAGWVFVPLVRYIIDNGAIHGGCMPSSHVAVALVILFWIRRRLPRLGTFLTPIVVVLTLGTAWGRFHYVTDVFAGIIVGVAALAITGFGRDVSPWEGQEAAPAHSMTTKPRTVSEGA